MINDIIIDIDKGGEEKRRCNSLLIIRLTIYSESEEFTVSGVGRISL